MKKQIHDSGRSESGPASSLGTCGAGQGLVALSPAEDAAQRHIPARTDVVDLAAWKVRRSAARRGPLMRHDDPEAGMATAEYAIATLAAVAFAALLVAVLGSGEVRGMLMSLIQSALSFG